MENFYPLRKMIFFLIDHTDLLKAKKLESEDKKNFINKYIEEYYKNHKKELDKAVEKAKNDWSKIENQFFELIDKLFSPDNENGLYVYQWPDGNYICYISIFNCNPRFIKEKEFQAFYKHNATTNYVCVHEMFHFIFYDYLEKNFSNEYKTFGESVIWKLSEIINDVVLRLPGFVVLTGQIDPAIYAQTEQELKKYMKMWKDSAEVADFVRNYFKAI